MAITVILVPADQAPPPGRHLLARIRCRNPIARATLREYSGDGAFTLPLPQIDSAAYDELWLVDEPVQELQLGPVYCRHTTQFRFCWLWVDMQSVPTDHTTACACTPHDGESGQGEHSPCARQSSAVYRQATAWAYQQLLNTLNTEPFTHPLKIWHYLPAINQGEGDQEHYRQFCRGREQALASQARPFSPLPAATAIGIPDAQAPMLMYWLSATEAGKNVENPRQTHAWRYPREYGPASPNFSRGTLSRACRQFLISGTASVVGHRTAHPFDTAAQSQEMLTNLEMLVDAARELSTACPGTLPRMQQLDGPLRIYLRNPQDWPQVATLLSAAGLPLNHAIPCHGDICRADLMVELDGFQALHATP